MARRMRHWVLVAATGCALLAVAKLPPEPFEGRRGEQAVRDSQEGRRYAALWADAHEAREDLRRLRWADTLAARAGNVAEGGWASGVLVEAADATDPAWTTGEDSLALWVAREMEVVPTRRSDAVVGAFVAWADFADVPGLIDDLGRPRSAFQTETFLVRRGDVTYCFNVQGVSSLQSIEWTFAEWGSEEKDHRRNTLGACRWVAEFGAPGPAVERWLRSGGLALAHAPDAERWRHLGLVGIFDPSNQGRRRGVLGLGGMWGSGRLDRCLAGRADACTALLADPLRLNDPPAGRRAAPAAPTEGPSMGPWGAWRNHAALFHWRWLMADLYAEFGPERTARFWTSPSEDVLVAFEDAFGIEPGAWVASWVRGGATYVPPGPLPRPRAWMWSLAVVAAGAGLAMLSARRRAVV